MQRKIKQCSSLGLIIPNIHIVSYWVEEQSPKSFEIYSISPAGVYHKTNNRSCLNLDKNIAGIMKTYYPQYHKTQTKHHSA